MNKLRNETQERPSIQEDRPSDWFEPLYSGPITDGEGVVGTFALRSPHRPNSIAAAVLRIEIIDSGSVSVRGLDCLNGTRLLDIKPAIMRELSR
jgi:tRNA (Thr-GGU) A37 N-methylase